MTYWKILSIIGILFLIIPNVHSVEIPAFVDVTNDAPRIESVRTYFSYVNDSVNTPETSFSAAEGKKVVYIQVKAIDENGFQDIFEYGSVKVKIVLWNGTSEKIFERFGNSYINAEFESGSGLRVIYTYSFEMGDFDPSRVGTETPPLYYRVKALITDGEYVVTSNLSEEQNADYTYQGLVPLFDITVDIPEDKKVVEPGDSIYARVTIAKIRPLGQDDIRITYQLLNPNETIVDSLMEVIAINETIQRLPVLYLPSDAVGGSYKFRATVSYQGTETFAEGSFRVQVIEIERRPTEEIPPKIPVREETKCIACIAGIPAEVVFEDIVKTAGIEKIELTTTRNMKEVCITVETIGTGLQYTYRYIKINAEDIYGDQNLQDSDISDVRIKFRVDKQWLQENNYDKDTIALNRYHDNEWQKLPTSLLSEDSDYIHYEAISQGFSLFTITAVPEEMKIALIDYPEEINILQGGTTIFSLIVENSGELPLENVIVSLKGALSTIGVFPSMVDALDIDSRQIFIIEASAPEELIPGEYKLTLRAISDYVTVKKEIKLLVMEKPELPEELERERLKAEIENIRGVIDRVWDETIESGLGGKNVTEAFRLLKESKESVNLAGNYLERKEYDKAREFIGKGRNSLEESVVTLSKIKVLGKVVEVPRVEYVLPEIYKILLIIIIIIALILIYERRRLKKTFKDVEEKFELDRLKAIFGRQEREEIAYKPKMKEMTKYKGVDDDMRDIGIIKKRLKI